MSDQIDPALAARYRKTVAELEASRGTRDGPSAGDPWQQFEDVRRELKGLGIPAATTQRLLSAAVDAANRDVRALVYRGIEARLARAGVAMPPQEED